jgi:hypothetical protein
MVRLTIIAWVTADHLLPCRTGTNWSRWRLAAMSNDLTSAKCREHAATARAAAQSTNLGLVRQKHLAAAQAWDDVAEQRQFAEMKRAERQADTDPLANSL